MQSIRRLSQYFIVCMLRIIDDSGDKSIDSIALYRLSEPSNSLEDFHRERYSELDAKTN